MLTSSWSYKQTTLTQALGYGNGEKGMREREEGEEEEEKNIP
jgi:hypothetical protein